MQVVKAVEAISIHQQVDRTIEKDLAPQLNRLADNSNSRKEDFSEGEWEVKEVNQKTKKKKQPGEGPNDF